MSVMAFLFNARDKLSESAVFAGVFLSETRRFFIGKKRAALKIAALSFINQLLLPHLSVLKAHHQIRAGLVPMNQFLVSMLLDDSC